MNIQIVDAFSICAYKLSCLVVGLAAIYMGYRLFLARAKAEPSDTVLQMQDWKVSIKKAAPGTLFALFGMIIVASTVMKGYHVHDSIGLPAPVVEQGNAKAVLPENPPS
jgi:hypothetical protein